MKATYHLAAPCHSAKPKEFRRGRTKTANPGNGIVGRLRLSSPDRSYLFATMANREQKS